MSFAENVGKQKRDKERMNDELSYGNYSDIVILDSQRNDMLLWNARIKEKIIDTSTGSHFVLDDPVKGVLDREEVSTGADIYQLQHVINSHNIFPENFFSDEFIDTSVSTGSRGDGYYLLKDGEVFQTTIISDEKLIYTSINPYISALYTSDGLLASGDVDIKAIIGSSEYNLTHNKDKEIEQNEIRNLILRIENNTGREVKLQDLMIFYSGERSEPIPYEGLKAYYSFDRTMVDSWGNHNLIKNNNIQKYFSFNGFDDNFIVSDINLGRTKLQCKQILETSDSSETPYVDSFSLEVKGIVNSIDNLNTKYFEKETSTGSEWSEGTLSNVQVVDNHLELIDDTSVGSRISPVFDVNTDMNVKKSNIKWSDGRNVLEGFESNNFSSQWTSTTNLNIRTDRTYEGSYSAGQTNGNNIDATYIPVSIQNGGNPDEISFYWQETSNQTGFTVQFRDDTGSEILAVGGNNPQWEIYDGDGSTTPSSGNGYDRWILYQLIFDWENGTYDYHFEDLSSGTVREGTRNLILNTNIQSININNNRWGSADYIWFDNIKTEFYTYSGIKVYTRFSTDEGTTWSSWQETLNGEEIPDVFGYNFKNGKIQTKEVLDPTGVYPIIYSSNFNLNFYYNIKYKEQSNAIFESEWNEGVLNWVEANNEGKLYLSDPSITQTGSRFSPELDLTYIDRPIESCIRWEANNTSNTNVRVQTNLSLDSGSTWFGWKEVENGGAIPDLKPSLTTDNINERVYAINFDRDTEQYIEYPNEYVGSNLRTYSVWFFPYQEETGNEEHIIISKDTDNGHGIYIDYSTSPNTIVGRITTDEGEIARIKHQLDSNDYGKWHHYVLRHGNGAIYLNINGIEKYYSTSVSSNNGSNNHNNSPLLIGGGVNNRYLNGKVGETFVSSSDSLISNTDEGNLIETLYNMTSKLKLNYPFDTGKYNFGYHNFGTDEYGLYVSTVNDIECERDKFAISFRAKFPSAIAYITNEFGFNIFSAGSSSTGFELGYLNKTDTISTPRFRLIDKENTITNDTSAPDLMDDNFHHIIFTTDGSKIKLFIDGQLYSDTDNTTSADKFIISEFFRGGYDEFINYAIGTFDEMAVYEKYLTNNEVELLYNSGNGKFFR